MNYIIPPPAVTSVPVQGGSAGDAASHFPVHRIYCVGRNYADHAREMGHDPDQEPPFFFLKPADTIVQDGESFAYPTATHDLQHEIELVAALGQGGRDIAVASALDCVIGYGVGIDLTRRDLQGEAKKLGRPWDSGKGFDNSAPLSALVLSRDVGHPSEGRISIDVNGETRQEGDLSFMIWKVAEVIARLSGLFTLAPGDLIYSGTPAGVGPISRGDELVGRIDGIGELSVTCE